MQTISATEAKQRFAALLDLSQREPVLIRRHDRDIAVLVSPTEYEDLRRLRTDRWAEFNRLSAVVAEQAKANGLTEETPAEFLERA